MTLTQFRLFTLNTASELICFFVALICLFKIEEKEWRISIYYLLLTSMVEIIGLNLKYVRPAVHNQWLYNLYLPFQAAYYFYMFNFLIKRYTQKKLFIIIPAIIWTISYFTELSIHGPFIYHISTFTIASLMNALLSFYYFYLLSRDNKFYNLTIYPPFWWAVGCLFFNFGGTVSNLLFDLIITYQIYLWYYIVNTLNIILYGCWSYAFICKRYLKPKLN